MAVTTDASVKKSYSPVGRCIYCGSDRHSIKQVMLGAEHIVPEGLGGRLLLPHASCGKCESLINRAETFCQKDMLGAFRYNLKLPSKRLKDRPTRLPVRFVNDDGKEEAGMISIEDYPVHLLIPRLPLPEMLLDYPFQKSNLETFQNYLPATRHCFDNPNKVKLYSSSRRVYTSVTVDSVVIPSGITDTYLFARMLAKIGHSYATAELGHGNFIPLLLPAIAGASNFPIHLLVGGEFEVSAPGVKRHELQLYSSECHGRQYWIVRVRLFADLGFPVFLCIAGVSPKNQAVLVRTMMQPTVGSLLRCRRIIECTSFEVRGVESTDHLCWRCAMKIYHGVSMPESVMVHCKHCQAWNMSENDNRPWRIPFKNLPDVHVPADQSSRVVWKLST